MSPFVYLARYASQGQHRRGRLDAAEHLAASLDETRARLGIARHDARSVGRRHHPAGRRLNPTGATPA